MATISQINIDGSTYDILDTKLKNTIANFYNSDTKSMNLLSTSTPAITVKSPVFYSSSDIPPNTITGTLIRYNDNTGQRRAYITHVSSTNGWQGMQLRTCKFNSNNELIYNPLDLFIDSNGVDTVYVAFPDAWKSGFGFGTDITTNTISEIITPFSSGITFNFARYRERHGIALIELSFKFNTAISVPNHGNFTDINIGKLVEGKRPILATHARSNGDEAGQAWFHIDTAGKVILCAAEGTGTARTIAANTNFNLSAMYIVA